MPGDLPKRQDLLACDGTRAHDSASLRDVAGRDVLVVVARRPSHGAVKRRLAAELGPARALTVYRDLLAGTLRSCEQVASVSLVLALAPRDGKSDEKDVAQADEGDAAGEHGPKDDRRWQTIPQRGAHLGARLAGLFAAAFGQGARSVVIVNSDSPALPPAYLRQAFDLLTGVAATTQSGPAKGVGNTPEAALVAGPTIDGGYYLIGAGRGAWEAHGEDVTGVLTETPLGTSTALARTARAAQTRGLRVRLLPLWVDVDEAGDLRLGERLTGGAAAPAAAAPRGEPLASLREVYLHVTHRCGLACPHCYDRDVAGEPAESTTQEWKAAIDQCVSLGAGSFVFIGGDPFLRDDVLELIDHVTGVRGCRARIFFNGLIDERAALALATAGHGRLRPLVSVDGPAEANDSLRGTGNFNDLLTSISNLVKAGLRPVANSVALAPVLPGLPDMARTLKNAGVERLHLIFPHPCGGLSDRPDLVPSGADLRDAFVRLREAASEIGVALDNVAAWKRRLRSRNDFCAAGCKDLAIDPYGKVYACPITCGDPAFVAGDLRTQTLETIWRESPGLRLLRHWHARDRSTCASCPVADACGGDCWMQAHYAARARGEPAGPTAPFPYCDLVRPVFAELLATEGEGALGHPSGAETPVGVGAPDYTLFDCI